MKVPWLNSLNKKLAATVIPLVLFFMAFNFFVIHRHEEQILRSETEKRAVSLAAGLSILAAEAQRTFSEYQLQQNVLEFSNLRDVVSVAIIDNQGRVLAHNVAQQRGKMLDAEAAGFAQKTEVETHRYATMGKQTVLEVYDPIYLGDRRTGTVLIVLSQVGLENALDRSMRYLTGLTLILLSGATIFVGFLARWFTSPLLRLAYVARELADGRLGARARATTNDEVGVLGSALNQMAQRLESMIAQEKDARNRLQKRVANLLEYTDRVISGDLNGQAEAGEDDEMGRLTLAVNEMVRHLRIILEDERSVRENLERSRAELEEANEKLKELDQLKSEFLNTVSHELRTPLTSIKAFAEILLDTEGGDPETLMEFLGIINKEADRLTRLINNLLDLSRIEAGRMNWHFEGCDLNELVTNACDVLRMASDKKGVEYVMHLSPTALPIFADSDKMIQVVTNLVGNALKFTPTGGVVEITTRQVRDSAEVVVKDSGMGIAPEHHQRIFEKFGQVDTSETREIKGSGLGLPIARSIVEAHKGTLTVDSDLGRGASFVVRVPIVGDSAREAPGATQGEIVAEASEEPRQAPQDRSVLIVDDEVNIRRFLRHILEQEGYDVLEAASGKEALQRASREKPNLILLDLRLGDMTGFEILEELKQKSDTRDIPVVILSIIQDKEQGFRLGASDFLNKPVDREKLIDRISRLISSPSQMDILVVEDDESVRRAIQVMLETQGFKVHPVSSAEEALVALSKLTPALILLDLMLPGISGNDFLTELRHHETWSNIPVIVLTAAGPESRTDALGRGAREVLGKPFSEGKLAELVRMNLAQYGPKET